MCGVTHRDKIRKRTHPRDNESGAGDELVWMDCYMWWGATKNTYWGKCWGRIHQGKGREDDRKQDGKTRTTETWKLAGEAVYRAAWKITSHTGDPIWWEKPRKQKNESKKTYFIVEWSRGRDRVAVAVLCRDSFTLYCVLEPGPRIQITGGQSLNGRANRHSYNKPKHNSILHYPKLHFNVNHSDISY